MTLRLTFILSTLSKGGSSIEREVPVNRGIILCCIYDTRGRTANTAARGINITLAVCINPEYIKQQPQRRPSVPQSSPFSTLYATSASMTIHKTMSTQGNKEKRKREKRKRGKRSEWRRGCAFPHLELLYSQYANRKINGVHFDTANYMVQER